MEKYAKKIGAKFKILSDRKFPDMPPNYEKFQLYEESKRSGDDWNIFFDADALINPDYFDMTNHIHKDTVAFNGKDQANVRFRYNEYNLRDGRHIGACTWLVVWSNWCTDLWYPIEGKIEDALECIHPITSENTTGLIDPKHLLDDYLLTKNIARFGLKHVCLKDIYHYFGVDDWRFLWHQYTIPQEQKATMMEQVLYQWGVKKAPVGVSYTPAQVPQHPPQMMRLGQGVPI
jgi:hypothetical protein